MEAYPDLKANQNMMQLTEELTSTENKVAFARQGYNDQVTEYNTYRQSFPPVILPVFRSWDRCGTPGIRGFRGHPGGALNLVQLTFLYRQP